MKVALACLGSTRPLVLRLQMHQLIVTSSLFFSLLCGISSDSAIACDSASCTCEGKHTLVYSRQQGCWVAASSNFQVYSFQSAYEAKHVALQCEKVRDLLSTAHGLAADGTSWNPKCQIFLHPNKLKYGAIVGKDFMQSLGSSLVRPETGKVSSRRIDLRVDVADYLHEVLPHELCHVLIADHFREGAPPLWYDEGLALLADSQSKQVLHQRDLQAGINRRAEFSLSEILTAKEYPAAGQVGVFYGQCASLARCLSKEGSPDKIHRFAKRCEEIGVNLALSECYGIAGLPELERQWRKSLNSPVAVTLAHVSLPRDSLKLPLRGAEGE